jgi:hypothetical protein
MIKHLSRLKRTYIKKKTLPIVIIVVIAVSGTVLLHASHAATPYISETADKGTLTNTATKVASCSGSTDGTCVMFGQVTSGGGGTTKTTDCFASPGACGYPDPNYNNNAGSTSVGATAACTSLATQHDGDYAVSTNGQTIQNMNIINGTLDISAANVTVNNVCVSNSGNSGAFAVNIGSGATNLLLEHSTFAGTAATGNGVLDTGVSNIPNTSHVTAESIYIYNAAEDWHGMGTVNDSYMQAGATFGSGSNESHNEDVYLSDTSWSGNHDTLLNSTGQTAILFGDNDGGAKDEPADNQWVLTNSLIGGGGYLMYLDAANNSSMPVGTSTMNISNNRFARCLGPQDFDGNGTTCTTGTDKYGYFPNGGYYGGAVDDYCSGANQTWSNNVWDDNNGAVSC